MISIVFAAFAASAFNVDVRKRLESILEALELVAWIR